MSKTAEQAIHDKLWQIVSPLVSDKVYESRPMTEVGYPFADFGDFQAAFTGTKNGATAQINADLNIWDTEDKRKNVSEIGESVFRQAMILKEAFGYPVMLRVSDSTIQVIQDRTVTPAIWRCIVHLEFNI
ncbi:MAG: hypothetical protein H2212_07310 [Ruminococcus sp.]|nr:hypothetical protein [Ruminococcus sp.]